MKIFILFSLLITKSFALCDPTYKKKLVSTPEKYGLVAVGVFSNKPKGYFGEKFILKRIWKSQIPEEILLLPYAVECGFHPYENKESFLIVSKSEVVGGKKLDLGSFEFFKMNSEEARTIISKMAEYKTEAFNPSWQYCEFNTDCTSVKNKCEIENSVNKKYSIHAQVFVDRQMCKSTLERKKILNKCSNNFCE